MAASLNQTIVDVAPGNTITITGSGLIGGSNATLTLNSQGVTALPGLSPMTIVLTPTFADDGNSFSFVVPDGVMDGTLTVTANDLTTSSCLLRSNSQYVQASEYIGEGEDTSTLAPTELDAILRRASSIADGIMLGSLRILQVVETQRYRAPKNGPPVFRTYRCRGRTCPIISVDQLTFISAKDLVTVFNPTDLYINSSLNYVEILAYAIGNYALLGMLQVIGYSANVLQLAYTSGFTSGQYPAAVREATIIIATSLLNRRKRQTFSMGPFSKFEDMITIDPKQMQVPIEARRLLLPYTITAMS